MKKSNQGILKNRNAYRVLYKCFMFFIVSITALISCADKIPSVSVIIEAQSDTLKNGDVYSADLFCKYNKELIPADFYIVQNNDTFSLDYNNDLKCGKFKAMSSKKGLQNHNGFVSFIGENETIQTKQFAIEFYVLDE